MFKETTWKLQKGIKSSRQESNHEIHVPNNILYLVITHVITCINKNSSI